MLRQIKVLLNLEDNKKDKLLETLISLKGRKLNGALGSENVPVELEYIVIELVVNHYNRLGSEGVMTRSVEGISTSFADSAKELEPYEDAIAKFLNKTSGQFRFY